MPVLAIPLGLLIGLALGALGGGGSILTVPALVYAAGQDPRTATTTSLVIVGITSLAAIVPTPGPAGCASARDLSSAGSAPPDRSQDRPYRHAYHRRSC